MLYIYVYIYVCIYICVCVYVLVYIYMCVRPLGSVWQSRHVYRQKQCATTPPSRPPTERRPPTTPSVQCLSSSSRRTAGLTACREWVSCVEETCRTVPAVPLFLHALSGKVAQLVQYGTFSSTKHRLSGRRSPDCRRVSLLGVESQIVAVLLRKFAVLYQLCHFSSKPLLPRHARLHLPGGQRRRRHVGDG